MDDDFTFLKEYGLSFSDDEEDFDIMEEDFDIMDDKNKIREIKEDYNKKIQLKQLKILKKTIEFQIKEKEKQLENDRILIKKIEQSMINIKGCEKIDNDDNKNERLIEYLENVLPYFDINDPFNVSSINYMYYEKENALEKYFEILEEIKKLNLIDLNKYKKLKNINKKNKFVYKHYHLLYTTVFDCEIKKRRRRAKKDEQENLKIKYKTHKLKDTQYDKFTLYKKEFKITNNNIVKNKNGLYTYKTKKYTFDQLYDIAENILSKIPNNKISNKKIPKKRRNKSYHPLYDLLYELSLPEEYILLFHVHDNKKYSIEINNLTFDECIKFNLFN